MWTALRTILLVFGIAAVSGCALITPGRALVVPEYALREPTSFVNSFRAGVGKVDITPPAGFPTGGHGPAGSIARGTWTRLHARAFFFADEHGGVAVFVSCELFAIPGGLTAQVARDVGRKWTERGVTIPAEAITLAATHTHQSPGNFMTSAAYNSFGSKYGGFSRELFYFLSQQIVSAIDIAISDALEHGRAELHVRKGTVKFLQLNRSPRTFLLNADALLTMDALHPPADKCEAVDERGEARENFDLFGCPRLRAADPSLTVLQITRDDGPVGAMVFYAAHPTVLDHHAPLYSGDFAGVAMSTLERQYPRNAYGATPVYGFFNGAEGDVVPRRSVRDVRDVVGIGEAFATSVKLALGSPPSTSASLTPLIAIRSVDVKAGDGCVDGDGHDVATGPHLAENPVVGAAALGGAEGDRTVLYELGFREGLLEIARDRQGGKLPALDSQLLQGVRLTAFLAPPRNFPMELPLRYVRIGSFVIATVPGEISTTGGRRIVALLQGQGDVVIVGLANEYTGYVATSEEYAAQDYMAASTIWGPGELGVFACQLATLQDAPAPHFQAIVNAKTYYPGHPPEDFDRRVTFGPRGIGDRRGAADEELGAILLDHRGVPARGLPTVLWRETAADLQADFAAAVHRRVLILVEHAGQWVLRPVSASSDEIDDDRGFGFVTMLLEAPQATDTVRMMVAIWLRPILDVRMSVGPYRFRVELTNDDGDFVSVCTSDPFIVDSDSATKPRMPLVAACVRPQ